MTKKKRKPSKKINEPNRRAVLFAPWRYKYIKATHEERKLKNGCVFCEALKQGVSEASLLLFSGENAAVILNKFPYNNGHIMVIPHSHTGELGELNAEEYAEMHLLLRRCHHALVKAYNPQGINIGMNLGRIGGAGIVDHLHYHLVPRWLGDTNFMPVIGGTKVISESLSQTYQKLLPLFS